MFNFIKKVRRYSWRIITINAKNSFLLKSVRKKISLSHCYKNSLKQIEGCLGHVCEQDSYSTFCWTNMASTLRGWPGKIYPVTLSQHSIAELPTQKKFPKQSEVWLSSSLSYIIWREIIPPWNKIVFVIYISDDALMICDDLLRFSSSPCWARLLWGPLPLRCSAAKIKAKSTIRCSVNLLLS